MRSTSQLEDIQHRLDSTADGGVRLVWMVGCGRKRICLGTPWGHYSPGLM
jgi:hypothetical protein